jgi:hypothetical protein
MSEIAKHRLVALLMWGGVTLGAFYAAWAASR